jgi:hypothetical protein
MAEPPLLTNDDASTWFADEIPDEWFESVRVIVDRDEITVVGTLVADSDDTEMSTDQRELHHIKWFREETREARVAVAQRAEATFERKVSWGTSCGGTEAAFTHLSVPVMTRLRMPERQLLDTLVAAGVARSRSDALGWCVRLVSDHEGDWLDELRDAISTVERVRAQGPT